MQPGYQFLCVLKPSKILRDLLPLYEVSSYSDIASVLYHYLNKKQILAEYFFKTFNIYVPILVKKALPKALKFYLSKSK